MEEIIKILEEHNIKCVQNGNDLSLSHKNFYICIKDVNKIETSEFLEYIEIKNHKVSVTVYLKHEYIHVTIL